MQLPWDEDLYLKALNFAAEAHQGQKVPGSELPYLLHVAGVCMEVLSAMVRNGEGNVNFAMQCALLHDTLEDTPVTFQELEEHFGRKVAEGVLALTKDDRLPAAERMADSLERIRQQPPEVQIVKMADRITNLQPPPSHWGREKCLQYQAEARLILKKLKGVNSKPACSRYCHKMQKKFRQKSRGNGKLPLDILAGQAATSSCLLTCTYPIIVQDLSFWKKPAPALSQ